MKRQRLTKVFNTLEECPPKFSGKLGNRFIDITGHKYNALKVLYLTGIRNKRSEWLCRCDCGKFVVVNSHNLRTNHTKSCGCIISEILREDLTGQIINGFRVLQYDYSKNGKPFWIVECLNCGKKYSVSANHIKKQKSCGCLYSTGEKKIKELFDKYGVEYKQQVTFPDLTGKSGNRLRFDFGVYENNKLLYLIEYQGIQHYQNVFNRDPDEYNYRLELDQKKREYCRCKNIELLEIKYDQEITIEKLLLFKTKGITAEDFVQYKKPCLFITNSICNGFKCDVENGARLCINSGLNQHPTKFISYEKIINMYLNNEITNSITFGGLENMDEFVQLFLLIKCLREKTQDDIVIYTGYNEKEIEEKIAILKKYPNIIVKFGRFVPNKMPHYDDVLGIKLASDNQYGKKIS